MRLAAYLILNILSIPFLAAQHDWWPVHPGQVNYYCIDTSAYQLDQKQIFSVYIVDSNQTAAGKNYSFNTYINQNINRNNFSCQFKLTSNPLGKQLQVFDSSYVLTTDAGMSIPFAKNTKQDDSIVIISPLNPEHRFSLTYVGQTTMNLYGNMDSIRVYRIGTIPQNIYYDSIILSKQYGLLRMPNIRILEDTNQADWVTPFHHWNIKGTLRLLGNSELSQSSIKKLSYRDCFDFEVGDVMQIKETRVNEFGKNGPDSSVSFNKAIIQRVIDKENYVDSVCYSILNESYHTNTIKSRTTNLMTNQYELDTQTICIKLSLNGLDSFPGTIIKQGSNLVTLTYGFHLNSIPTIESHYIFWLSRSSDTCANYLADVSYNKPYLFYKSLGGPYYYSYSESTSSGSFYSTENERKLEYYSNRQGTWGTPYPFPLSVNEHNGSKKNAVKCYPNPAKQNFTIESKEVQSITITDITGKIVYENQQAEPLTTIACKDWLAGVYVVHISSATQRNQAKLIITH